MRTFFQKRPDPESFHRSSGARAFSLIELLVTLVIFSLVLVTLFQFTASVQQTWESAQADPFAEAEGAFEKLVNRAAGATLETYQDYVDTNGLFRTNASSSFTPDHLARRSDLAFVCGPASGTSGWLNGSGRITTTDSLFFAAPQGYTQTEAHLGLERLLDALGYFVEFSDESNAPGFLPVSSHRWRWRLKEVVQPSEALGIYTVGTSLPWVQTLVQAGAPISILADNVAALIVLPENAANDPTGTLPSSYSYDSRDAGNPLTRNQLPGRLRLALVAIDEASAQILAAHDGSQPPVLVAPTLFTDAANMDADLATLNSSLTASRIRHRVLQREIILPSAAWSEALSQ